MTPLAASTMSGTWTSVSPSRSQSRSSISRFARALANDPAVLLADEPTGSLDSEAGRNILDLLERIREERDTTIVLVTHDAAVAGRADRIVRMLDGRLDESPDPPKPALTLVRTLRPAVVSAEGRRDE